MQNATRKTLSIMLAIMAMEGVPMALSLIGASRAGWQHLYTASPTEWPAWMAAAAIAVAYTLYAIRGLPLIGRRFFDAHWLKLLAIPFALITGSMEEFWFRRLIMDWVQNLNGNSIAQIAASALLFGLVHSVWGTFARRWRVALGSMVATGVLGFALALVYLLGHRHVAPCVWSHIAINLAIEPWLIMAAVSGGKPSRASPRAGSQNPVAR